jgi:hypothetical protein
MLLFVLRCDVAGTIAVLELVVGLKTLSSS